MFPALPDVSTVNEILNLFMGKNQICNFSLYGPLKRFNTERIGFSCEARRSSLAGTSFLSWKEFSERLEDGQCGFHGVTLKIVLAKPEQWSESRRWYAVKGIVTMLGQYQQGDVVIVFGSAVFYPFEIRVIFVPDLGSQDRDVILVRRRAWWGNPNGGGNLEGGGMGRGLRKGRSVYEQPGTKVDRIASRQRRVSK
jgi:hypothetical protein